MGPVSMTSMSSASVLQLDWESRVQINELEPPFPPTKVSGANKEGDEEYRRGIKSPSIQKKTVYLYTATPHSAHDLQYLIGLCYFKFFHIQTLRKGCVKAYERC